MQKEGDYGIEERRGRRNSSRGTKELTVTALYFEQTFPMSMSKW